MPALLAAATRVLVLSLLLAAAALSVAVAASLSVGSASLGAYGGTCTQPLPTQPGDESPYTIPCN